MTLEPPPKVCPQCGEEYLHTVSVCADCGARLVAAEEAAAAQAAAEADAAPGLPPASELLAVRSAGVAWISGLAEAFEAEGVPFRVEATEGAGAGARRRSEGARCTLFVRREDADRAARIDVEFARTQIPDLPEEVRSGWAESEACPACGANLSEGENECAGCGLVFAGEE